MSNKKDSKKVSQRVKNFSFILYPEKTLVYENLCRYLEKSGYMAAISPLHKPDDEQLKPHYHVVVSLSSPRELSSLAQEFLPLCSSLCTLPQRVGSLSGITRYLTHMDNKEKQQFVEKPILFGGYPYEKLVFKPISGIESINGLSDLFDIIESNNINGYSDLLKCLLILDKADLVDFCLSHSYAINATLRSYRK